MGAERVAGAAAAADAGRARGGASVVWACDPMHANAFAPRPGQDAPLRRDHGRDRGLLRRLPRGGGVAGRGPPRVHGRGRDRVPRRRRGGARGSALAALRDALRSAPERPPVARPGVPPGRAHAGGARHRARGSRVSPIVGLGLIGGSIGLAARAPASSVSAAAIPIRARSRVARSSAAPSTSRG